jgi:hypothetical protein
MSFADFYRGPYNLKALADYDTGEATAISAKQAAAAIEAGRRFVSHFAALIANSEETDPDTKP